MPYGYTVGSDKWIQGIRADRVPEELWTEVCNIVQGSSDQHHLQEKEMQKDTMVVRGGLTNSWEKNKAKEKREDVPIWMQSFKQQQGVIRKPSYVNIAKK